MPDRDDSDAAAKGKRAGVTFGIIFGLQGGLIALISVLLGRSNLGDWIPAVALIVGAHFLPLASVFEVPVYYWTGGISIFGTLACLLIHAVGPRLLCVGLVMGTVPLVDHTPAHRANAIPAGLTGSRPYRTSGEKIGESMGVKRILR